jgi:hypothetical protein
MYEDDHNLWAKDINNLKLADFYTDEFSQTICGLTSCWHCSRLCMNVFRPMYAYVSLCMKTTIIYGQTLLITWNWQAFTPTNWTDHLRSHLKAQADYFMYAFIYVCLLCVGPCNKTIYNNYTVPCTTSVFHDRSRWPIISDVNAHKETVHVSTDEIQNFRWLENWHPLSPS